MHVFALAPALEQAPDQIASRALLTLSVIDVPVANAAEPVLPTATLIPAGVDVTRSPALPVAVTVSVDDAAGGGAGGVTVSTAVLVTPPKLAEMVAEVDAVTDTVVTVNVALVAPAGTVTLPLSGTLATAVLLLDSVTTAPPAGAAALRVTVATDELPPTTLVGFRAKPEIVRGGGAPGGETVSSAVFDTPPKEAVIVTELDSVTAVVVTVELAEVDPAATVTLAGAVAAVLLLVSVTTTPPVGAAAVKATVPLEEVPPTTLAGLTDTSDKLAAAGAACGVKRRVAENGPKPAEFCARTRHHRRLAGRPPIVACETVTVALATKGAAIVWESST